MIKGFLIGLLCIPFSWAGAEELGPFVARVQVDLTAGEAIRGQMEACLNRKLRSLGDVVITDESPEWQLLVVALETTSGGRVNGAAVSVVVLKPIDNTFVLDATREEAAELVTVIPSSSLVEYYGNSLRVGPLNALEKMCDKIVTEFDARDLELARRHWQSMVESEKSLKERASRK